MANKLLDYWCVEFEKAHGVKYPAGARDAGVLKKILETCGDKKSLAWEIKQFHAKEWRSSFIAEAGYDTRMFSRMHLGLHIEYAKGREKELELQKRQHQAELTLAADSGVVIDLAERIGRRV